MVFGKWGGKMFNNKKADLSVTLLVFMTVGLCLAALALFMINAGSQAKSLSSYGSINSFYADNDLFEVYLKSLAQNTVNNLMLNTNTDLSTPAGTLDFKNKFSTQFIASYMNSPKKYLSQVYIDQIVKGNYILDLEGNSLKVTLKDFEFTRVDDLMNNQEIDVLKLKKDISFSVVLNKL